jgi:glycosyltransferase involved in cell wall biosynthesis
MPPGHEHDYNPVILAREEQEYDLADYLLCPSDFVASTFRARGFSDKKLLRNQYGFNEKIFFPPTTRHPNPGLCALFVGGCAPRKGLHYALAAWFESKACDHGTFKIAGGFIPGYAERLAKELSHPSIQVLGHRSDVADLMRSADVLLLPSIEEGSALVTSEARGCGCVLLVSHAAGAICVHGENALVHTPGDVRTLAAHLTSVATNKTELERLRRASLATVDQLTWNSAGRILNEIYVVASKGKRE